MEGGSWKLKVESLAVIERGLKAGIKCRETVKKNNVRSGRPRNYQERVRPRRNARIIFGNHQERQTASQAEQ